MIVNFLLENALPGHTVYCIPFEHLTSFYQQHGFSPVNDLGQVPQELLKKYLWCKQKYTQPVSLLFLKKGVHSMDFEDVSVGQSYIGQFEDGLGVFTKRDFKQGEVVIKWHLQMLSQEEFDQLSEYERNNFCHKRGGVIHYYPIPERYVNRSDNPNVYPDFEKEANIALRDIKCGEELSIPAAAVEDF